jgi:hypothetical protein
MVPLGISQHLRHRGGDRPPLGHPPRPLDSHAARNDVFLDELHHRVACELVVLLAVLRSQTARTCLGHGLPDARAGAVDALEGTGWKVIHSDESSLGRELIDERTPCPGG